MVSYGFEHRAISRITREEEPLLRPQNNERAPHGSVPVEESAGSPVLCWSEYDINVPSRGRSDGVSVPPVHLNAIGDPNFAHERFDTNRHDPSIVRRSDITLK